MNTSTVHYIWASFCDFYVGNVKMLQ